MMILSIRSNEDLDEAFERIGLRAALEKSGSALLKVNLARPPEPGHPRTDAALLGNVIRYFSRHGASCAVAECANGFLNENLERIGLGQLLREHQVTVIDLDREDFDRVVVDDEEHYLPKCLREYGTRIGIPALSKRSGMIFSNNVKLFVGAVPRRMYQLGEETTWRPRVHVDLHRSVANIYRAVMSYAPFEFFVNGGRAMIEGRGELELPVLLGDNGWELDRYLLEQLHLEQPGYLERLVEPDPMCRHEHG